jgi:predicted ATPase
MRLGIARYRAAVRIPDEVRETVLRRVHLLRPDARQVVLRASVIGPRFDLAVLCATVNQDEAAIRAALDEACRLQLTIADRGDRWSFRHAVTREIMYAEVAGTAVRRLHRRIVRALEQTGGAEPPLHDLAYHAWAAGDARRGVRYNERAGDHAAAMHADDDARTLYTRARGMAPIGSRSFARLSAKLQRLSPSRGDVSAPGE